MSDRELIDAALAGPLAEIADDVRAAMRPSVRLLRSSRPRTGSRIGGAPDLPAEVEWPERQGRPLAFLAQVELADLPDVQPGRDLLPGAGHLAFFYDAEAEPRPWGFDPADAGGARIVYVPPGADMSPSHARNGSELYASGHLDYEVELTLPESDAIGFPELPRRSALDDAYFDLLMQLDDSRGDNTVPRHRLLGNPDQIQNEMQSECQLVSQGIYLGHSYDPEDPRIAALLAGAAEWRLVLQLDSEVEPRTVEWDDGGRVYFWARESDLRARRFECAWAILQSS